MRTFEYSDARSRKFWKIERNEKELIVRFGRISSAGQTREKPFPTEAAALMEYEKLITTPSAKPAASSLRESIEQSLLENPDDLASHMAYADYLAEQGDPLGDFVRVQLALENESLPKMPKLSEPAVKALVHSPHLKSLTHLPLRLSDMGDKGVKTIIDSGVLGRLRELDLRHGCVTEEGARRLAACPDARKLDRLDLTGNRIGDAGLQALRDAGVKVEARFQWVPTGDEGSDTEYLYAGDME